MLPGFTPVFCVLLFEFPFVFIPGFEFIPGFGPVLRSVYPRKTLPAREFMLEICFPYTTKWQTSSLLEVRSKSWITSSAELAFSSDTRL